jgi:hypothetical protein
VSNKPPKGSKLIGDWKGRRVKLRQDVETNGGVRYPAGSLATVVSAYHGLELQGDPCACCGVRLRLRKISTHMVEEINQ